MNLFRSNAVDLGEAFQAEFAREILISQRLRASVLIGVLAAGLLLLLAGHVVFGRILNQGFYPGPVMPFSVVMMIFQLGIRQYTSHAIWKERAIPSWTWYVSAGVEITLVTLMFLMLRFNYESPTYVLSAPAILGYALFITLSTLRLDGRFSLFVGGLAAAQYLGISLLVYGSAAGLSAYLPEYETLFFCFVRSAILLMCGVVAAFVARELRMRMHRSYRVLEERNRVEAANQAKSTFLANVSHEIRTPLNAILGYSQLMASDRSLSAEQLQSIENISTSGGHLTDLINRVLDLSKIEAGREELQAEDFDLAAMAQELEAMFQLRCEQKGLDWAVHLDASPLWVQGDAGKLRQVLINLLGNAVKFTDAGRVVLKVEARPEDHLYFEVFDTGPGIPIERQSAIFDPFQQLTTAHQREGTGLGLAIASGYVSIMGGQLEVASVPGVETRFFFTLHLAPSSDDRDFRTDPVIHLASESEVRALVVDDVAENRDILAQILARVGVDVQLAEDGTRALERVAESVPDIVFMDILMPALSGEETMRQLREAYGRDQCKIVAVSASVLEHQRRAYLAAGFDGVLDKPIQMNRVYAMLERLLDVQFVYESDVAEHAVASMDLTETKLPEPIFVGLQRAASAYNVTQFNEYLDEAEALGEAEKQLVAPLRRLSQQYDMKSALETLEGMNHG